MGGGALARRPARRCRGWRRCPWRNRGAGACAQRRDRRDGARIFALGMVAGDVRRRRTGLDADIDALAVRSGPGKFVRLDRTVVQFPPTDYNRIGATYTAFCGTARPDRDRARDRRAAHRQGIQRPRLRPGAGPEVVLGQAQGGFAMGVGYALLELLPPFETGPGNGQWNLGDYVIARGSDLPLHDLEIEVLPPVDAKEAPKGMAEVVMIPVVAALLNAIFDATGHRFQSLPVTENMLKGALS